jgi:hypothetical protein
MPQRIITEVLKLFRWDRGYRWYRQEPAAMQGVTAV